MINLFRIYILSIIFFASLIFASLQVRADSIPTTIPNNVLNIGIVNSTPPFVFKSSDGVLSGFDVDISQKIMSEMSFNKNEYKFHIGNRDDLIQQLKDNKIDCIIGLDYYSGIEKEVLVGETILFLNLNIISRNNENYQTLDEIKEKTIITKRNSSAHKFLIKNNITTKFIFRDSMEDAILLLRSGKGDVIFGNDVLAKHIFNKLKSYDLSSVISSAPQVKHFIATNKENPELLAKLNLALRNAKSKDSFLAIYNKWLISAGDETRIAIYLSILGISVLLVLLLLLFIWFLRRQVSRATLKIKKAQQEFELAINAGNIYVWTYDISTRTFSMLKGSANKLEIPFEKLKNILHPDDYQPMVHLMNNLSNERITSASEIFRAKLTSRNEYHSFETTMVLSHKNKDESSKIVGTLKDITKDLSIQKILEEFKVKTNFITTASGIILFKYDIKNSRFSQINDRENTIVHSFDYNQYLALVHEDDIDKAKEFINLMQLGASKYISTEYRMLSNEKKYEWYAIEAMAYKYDSENKITKYLGLRRNNSKWKNITDDLIELRTKAEVANKLKSAFLANMSHEIRTPLNAIVGFSDLITDCDDPEDKEHYKSIIKTNNDLLLQLINDVLDLSKIEAGFADFKFTTFEFSSYFNELYDSLKLRTPNGVEFINNSPKGPLNVYADKNRISQIITNFATNAFKFTKNGHVTLSYSYDDKMLKIEVADTGIGISKENQKRVFERFEKINEFAQGTGLGLPICQSLVEAMNGFIGVESKEGEGSTFWIKIPYANPFANATDGNIQKELVTSKKLKNQHKSASTIQYMGNEKKTLLIAEDMDNNYILAKRLLEDEYKILRANNGEEAVRLTQEHNPDFILMDIKMPVMDGLTATAKIREFNPTVPIIALTAYVYDTNQNEATQSGCNAFLTKPYKKTILRETLKNIGTPYNEEEEKEKEKE